MNKEKELLERVINKTYTRIQSTGESAHDSSLMSAYLDLSNFYIENNEQEKAENSFKLGFSEYRKVVKSKNKLPVENYETRVDNTNYNIERKDIVKSLIGYETKIRGVAKRLGYDESTFILDMPTIKGRDEGELEKFLEAKPLFQLNHTTRMAYGRDNL